MTWVCRLLALPAVALAPTLAAAQGVVVDHKKVDCIVAGQYPRMNACFQPAGKPGKRRVYFRPEGVTSWFYVEMKSNAPCHEGILPKPKKELVAKHVFYYIAQEGADSGQTQEYDPVVVRTARECKKDVVAPFLPKATVAVFPSVPAGFLAAGAGALSVPVVAGAVAVVAGGTAAAITLGKDDNPTVGTTLPGTPVTTAPPATTLPPTTPTTTVPPTTRQPLDLTCTADPRSGDAPLRVAFRAFPAGGTGVYDFLWDFADGGTSTQVSPGHTYTSPGSYLASVRVTSGTDVARCERSITVTTPPTPPPPPPPPAGPFTLAVALAGSGTGTVASAPAGIACPADCTEPYAAGTPVTLTATPTGGSTFAGWTGAGCSGTGPCTVLMNASQTVTATFNPPAPTFLLTVILTGTGTGTVTSAPAGISCGPDCTEPYASGTLVTLTATPTGGSTFGGWSGGGCSGTAGCTVTMNAAQTVSALFNPSGCIATLNVTLSGTGNGTVASVPGGISCLGTDCTEPYACGTTVRLTATPAPLSTFATWSGGGCTGNGNCSVVMNVDTTVDARFDATAFNLFVGVAGQFGGGGRVVSTPAGIDCSAPPQPGDVCMAPFAPATVVRLTPTGCQGCTPVRWGADCAGTPDGAQCSVTMDQTRAATAIFPLGLTGPRSGQAALRWTSEIEAPDAAGQSFLNGGFAGDQKTGRAELRGEARGGANHLEAVLTGARGPGLWRFEFADGAGLEPGSLVPLQGEVVQVTTQSIVFRLKGEAGERIAFSFRRQD
jgi:PKD repeat protein